MVVTAAFPSESLALPCGYPPRVDVYAPPPPRNGKSPLTPRFANERRLAHSSE